MSRRSDVDGVPTRPGANPFTAQTVLAGGTLSEAVTVTTVAGVDADGVVSDARDFEYASLSSSIYAYGFFDGGVGVQGMFTVFSDLDPVIVDYHWASTEVRSRSQRSTRVARASPNRTTNRLAPGPAPCRFRPNTTAACCRR
jgi:hypothetical protein